MIDNNIDASKLIDNMKPFEFRLKKDDNFLVHTLPLTKNKEQYLMLEQLDKRQIDTLHYYIVNSGTTVIGRFDIGWDESSYGITYHIVDEFQNRGIGQTALKFVVGELFNKYNASRIIIAAINDRSRSIALKSGFHKMDEKTERIYELSSAGFQRTKSKKSDLDER